MQVIATMEDGVNNYSPPLLKLIIHGAPHVRMHRKFVKLYGDELLKACFTAGIPTPIGFRVDLWVHFIDPCSAEYDHLLTRLFEALDKRVLKDDSLIWTVRHLSKYYTSSRS